MQFHPVEIHLDGGATLTGWCTQQGHDRVLFFAHGNGFCGRVYESLHRLLAEKYELLMLDIPGHGRSPASEFVGWNQTAEYLWQGIAASDSYIDGRELHAVGHSLGGMLSMLAASRHPSVFKSMVMLDPIMFPPLLLALMHVVKVLGLTRVFHPFVNSTLRRRNGWQNESEAFSYFYQRKIFKNWTDEALNSYVEHALIAVEKNGSSQLRLRCEPTLEANWFSSLPKRLWPSVKALSCPVTIGMGKETYPFSLRAGNYAQKINPSITFNIVEGGHCFMQENPADAANFVFQALEKQKGQQ